MRTKKYKSRKKTLNRSLYIFSECVIILRSGTKFDKLFREWYLSDSNILPNRVYDYLMDYKQERFK